MMQIISNKVKFVIYIFIIIGVLVFFSGILGFSSQRIWQAYLVNFVFWSGLAQGGVVFSAAYRITNGKWGETMRRISEGFVFFIPLNILFVIVLLLGKNYIWNWIDHPIQEKKIWLDQDFFTLRIIFYFLFMALLSIWYVYRSVRPDIGLKFEQGVGTNSKLIKYIIRNWRGYDVENENSNRTLTKLTPLVLLSYAVIYSMIGFDVVMSLDPHWYSTLYGWLHFVHEFYAGVVAILLATILTRKYFGLDNQIKLSEFYDASRLVMGLGLLAGGFYWAQFLVIWYGNLSDEIRRLMIRFNQQPWTGVQWTVISVLYFLPLIVFLSRSIKEKPIFLVPVSVIILIGIWLYQFIEITPSIWREPYLPFGFIEIGITLGFIGAFALCFIMYLQTIFSFSQIDINNLR